jgi:hypothetical protein
MLAIYSIAIIWPSAITPAEYDAELGSIVFGGSERISMIYTLAGTVALLLGSVGTIASRSSRLFGQAYGEFLFVIGIILYSVAWLFIYISVPTAPMQLAQLVLTMFVYLGFVCAWYLPRAKILKGLALVSYVVAGCLIGALLLNGLPENRWVGGIHPNFFARFAWVAFALHSLSLRRISRIGLLGCTIASFIVSTRTILVGEVFFLLLYFMVAVTNARQRRVAVLSAVLVSGVVAIGILIVLFSGYSTYIITWFTDALELTSSVRGVTSGFTGRTEVWSSFFDRLPEFVAFGAGFRSVRYQDYVIHNGFLTYFVDFGLPMGLVVVSAVATKIVYVIRKSVLHHDNLGSLAGCLAAASLLMQFSEPDNFNIGFLGSVLFMLLLAFQPRHVRQV